MSLTPTTSPHILAFAYPLFSSISAGFPSPADDFVEQQLDLNRLCVPHPSSTFFFRVGHNRLHGEGILSGDIVIVDRTAVPTPDGLVVAVIDNELCVQRAQRMPNGRIHVEQATEESAEEVQVWGVVTGIVRVISS